MDDRLRRRVLEPASGLGREEQQRLAVLGTIATIRLPQPLAIGAATGSAAEKVYVPIS